VDTPGGQIRTVSGSAVGQQGRVRAWSRRGTSLGGHLDSLLAPLAEGPRGTIVDGELVALSSCDGRAVQDFGAVCRAVLHADAVAASKFHLVAFDLLELAGDDVRSLPWVKRTELLRGVSPRRRAASRGPDATSQSCRP
jgi:ATP-dependent DNA ligase